jgi:Winged helix DNA-binding domain
VSERVLSPAELNRALLARQLLLKRARLSIPRALDRIGGIQAQYAPAMYIGLWCRLEGFERAALTRALERRSVVQGTMMRATIHLVSRSDYWPLELAISGPRREWWDRVHKHSTPAEMRRAAKRLRRTLSGRTMRRKEILELLGPEVALGIGTYVDLVRAPPSGTWEQRRADLFALADDWIERPQVDRAAALDHLIRRYLGGFGPSAKAEIADWAGLNVSEVSAGLERMRLRRFRDEAGRELVDLPRAPLPDATTPAPPRFIPVWDATLLVHARGTGILPEEYRPVIFNTKTPHSFNTFLVDGKVAGMWRYEEGKVALAPFEGVPRRWKRELDEETTRLADLYA